MTSASYHQFRGNLETYFDRTAQRAWEQLTSDAPVSGIRATVRAGRTKMRGTLLDWLGEDLRGRRVLDAGCGTGALAIEAALRGAEVVAIDVAGSLVAIGRDRAPNGLAIDWRVGDMLDPALGRFDHVVAMDSLIHYPAVDMVGAMTRLADHTRGSIAMTFAPRTPLLMAMLGAGRLFPRADKSPAILPVQHRHLQTLVGQAIPKARFGRDCRIAAGFYISHAMEVLV